MAKILLVEDDTNLSEIYQARMEAEGYEVVGAPDGESALALAAKEKPDLIISDVMMPKISGFEMLDILRNTEGLKHTRVIMLSALGQAEDRTRAEGLGADKYLVKSQVTLEDIVAAAQELLGDGGDSLPTPAEMAAPTVTAAPEPTPMAPVDPVPVQPAPTGPLTATTPAPLPEPAESSLPAAIAVAEAPVFDDQPATDVTAAALLPQDASASDPLMTTLAADDQTAGQTAEQPYEAPAAEIAIAVEPAADAQPAVMPVATAPETPVTADADPQTYTPPSPPDTNPTYDNTGNPPPKVPASEGADAYPQPTTDTPAAITDQPAALADPAGPGLTEPLLSDELLAELQAASPPVTETPEIPETPAEPQPTVIDDSITVPPPEPTPALTQLVAATAEPVELAVAAESPAPVESAPQPEPAVEPVDTAVDSLLPEIAAVEPTGQPPAPAAGPLTPVPATQEATAPAAAETVAPPIAQPQPPVPATAAMIDERVVANAVDKLLAKAPSTAEALVEAAISPSNPNGAHLRKKVIAPLEHPPTPSLQDLLAAETAKDTVAAQTPAATNLPAAAAPAAAPQAVNVPTAVTQPQPQDTVSDEARAAELLAKARADAELHPKPKEEEFDPSSISL